MSRSPPPEKTSHRPAATAAAPRRTMARKRGAVLRVSRSPACGAQRQMEAEEESGKKEVEAEAEEAEAEAEEEAEAEAEGCAAARRRDGESSMASTAIDEAPGLLVAAGLLVAVAGAPETAVRTPQF